MLLLIPSASCCFSHSLSSGFQSHLRTTCLLPVLGESPSFAAERMTSHVLLFSHIHIHVLVYVAASRLGLIALARAVPGPTAPGTGLVVTGNRGLLLGPLQSRAGLVLPPSSSPASCPGCPQADTAGDHRVIEPPGVLGWKGPTRIIEPSSYNSIIGVCSCSAFPSP